MQRAFRWTCDWGWLLFLCGCFAQSVRPIEESRVVLVSAVWLPPCSPAQNESGIRILDADPSIRCDEVREGA